MNNVQNCHSYINNTIDTNLYILFIFDVPFRKGGGEREREREREKKVGGVVRDTTVFGGGCNRNIIWQFGSFPGSAR
jgi:hypothetical protein